MNSTVLLTIDSRVFLSIRPMAPGYFRQKACIFSAASRLLPPPALPVRLATVPGVGVTVFPDRQLLLPSYLSAFFGRDEERRELAARLVGPRLVTLSGPGGCGKTRLAIEVGRDIADRFETLVFVGLAEITTPKGVFEAMQQAMRLAPPRQDAEARVLDFLCERDALLILDNFEQLVPQASQVVARLLGALPRLRCLVTSRRVLMIEGEHEFALAPLPLPSEKTSASSTGMARPMTTMSSLSGRIWGGRNCRCRPILSMTSPTTAVNSSFFASLNSSSSDFQSGINSPFECASVACVAGGAGGGHCTRPPGRTPRSSERHVCSIVIRGIGSGML